MRYRCATAAGGSYFFKELKGFSFDFGLAVLSEKAKLPNSAKRGAYAKLKVKLTPLVPQEGSGGKGAWVT